jgi:hypothetical protein
LRSALPLVYEGPVDSSTLTSFAWLEGSRLFSIVFGTVTAAMCLSLGIPILTWVLPSSRAWLFPRSVDPHQYLQIGYGVLCMAMACTDALCRYIPHRPLGWVHPAFFVTTVALTLMLGPWIVALVVRRLRDGSVASMVRLPGASVARIGLAAILLALIALPSLTTIDAFW